MLTKQNSTRTRRPRLVLPALVLAGVGFLGLQQPVSADQFNPGTLDELINAFKRAGNNVQDDVIDLGGQTFTLASELVLEPDEGHALLLRNGALVRDDSASYFRLLRLDKVPYFIENEGKPVQLQDLEFRNGFYNDTDLTQDSVGGGALLSLRKTVIKDSRFINNYSMGNTAGGAISHTNAMEISTGFFANNEVFISEESQVAQGGAIASLPGSSLFISHSYFLGNSADEGGAVFADHGVTDMNITRTTFDGNKANTLGGAIWSAVGDGELRISNSSFIANKAPLGGGALFSNSMFADVVLSHLTFWGNQSDSGNGGGIKALIPRNGSKIVLHNSVVTNNVGGNCITTDNEPLSLKHSAYNLVDDVSCGLDGTSVLTGVGSVFAGKLDFYGGLVPSLPIHKSSLASNLVPRDLCLGFDARDVPRLDNGEELDSYCDAGAFEFVPIEQIDLDGDDVRNRLDNCVDSSNPLQSDIDNDGVGDSCDHRDDRDSDGDTVLNFIDNCLTVSNFLQLDSNNDGMGDACSQSSAILDSVSRISTANQ